MIFTSSPTRWEQMLTKPLARRMEQAPEELVNFVAQYNMATGSSVQPYGVPPDIDFLDDVRAAVDELPQKIKDQIEPRLLGVFFMKGLTSSAFMDLVAYANGDLLGAVVVIDVEVFAGCKANAWMTWRENTAFSSVPNVRLNIRIAHDKDDNRKSALQYDLLHEFGHVLASASDVMPNWWEEKIPPERIGPGSFPALSWQITSEGRMTPIASEDFPLRSEIRLYQTPSLTGDQIQSVYEDLNKTVFPTIYAASDVNEDFAESFATYVHTVLFKKPYELQIYQDDQLICSYGNFWDAPRSCAKAAFFEGFLSRPPKPFPRRQVHVEMAELCKAIIDRSHTDFLGLAPFLRSSIGSGDLRHVAQELLAQALKYQGNAVLWMNMSTAFFSVGEHGLGTAMQQEALQLRRQFHLPAAIQPARYHILMLVAPGDLAENTPLDCLLESGAVDLTLYYLTPEASLPTELPSHDVLLVGLSDTSKNRPILEMLQPILSDWECPVVNRPQFIPNVERKTASLLLQDVPGLVMPLTHQIARAPLESIARGELHLNALYEDCHFPIILRPIGSHAGRDLRRMDGESDIASYLESVLDSEFYISRFVDYRSQDGLFRKYRIVLIDGQPFACHMAISSDWMIHYVNAGMYVEESKRAEEAAFMDNFDEFLDRHRTALTEIAQRCGLDYIGIDCAESPGGELLIFEVDHAMVVHAMDSEDLFPHKQQHILKIRQAFEEFISEKIDLCNQ